MSRDFSSSVSFESAEPSSHDRVAFLQKQLRVVDDAINLVSTNHKHEIARKLGTATVAGGNGGGSATAAVAAGPQRSQSTVDMHNQKKSSLVGTSPKDTSFAIDTMGVERATCPHCLQDMEARKLKVHMSKRCQNKLITCPEPNCGRKLHVEQLRRHFAEECVPARKRKELLDQAKFKKEQEELKRLQAVIDKREAALKAEEEAKMERERLASLSAEERAAAAADKVRSSGSALVSSSAGLGSSNGATNEAEPMFRLCHQCGDSMRSSQMAEHLKRQCLKRKIMCPHVASGGCDVMDIPLMNLQKHLDEECAAVQARDLMLQNCAQRKEPVFCVDCGESVELRHMKKHEAELCQFRRVPCRNHFLGCQVRPRLCERALHEWVDGKQQARLSLYMNGQMTHLAVKESDVTCPWTVEYWVYRAPARESAKTGVRNALILSADYLAAHCAETVIATTVLKITSDLAKPMEVKPFKHDPSKGMSKEAAKNLAIKEASEKRMQMVLQLSDLVTSYNDAVLTQCAALQRLAIQIENALASIKEFTAEIGYHDDSILNFSNLMAQYPGTEPSCVFVPLPPPPTLFRSNSNSNSSTTAAQSSVDAELTGIGRGGNKMKKNRNKKEMTMMNEGNKSGDENNSSTVNSRVSTADLDAADVNGTRRNSAASTAASIMTGVSAIKDNNENNNDDNSEEDEDGEGERDYDALVAEAEEIDYNLVMINEDVPPTNIEEGPSTDNDQTEDEEDKSHDDDDDDGNGNGNGAAVDSSRPSSSHEPENDVLGDEGGLVVSGKNSDSRRRRRRRHNPHSKSSKDIVPKAPLPPTPEEVAQKMFSECDVDTLCAYVFGDSCINALYSYALRRHYPVLFALLKEHAVRGNVFSGKVGKKAREAPPPPSVQNTAAVDGGGGSQPPVQKVTIRSASPANNTNSGGLDDNRKNEMKLDNEQEEEASLSSKELMERESKRIEELQIWQLFGLFTVANSGFSNNTRIPVFLSAAEKERKMNRAIEAQAQVLDHVAKIRVAAPKTESYSSDEEGGNVDSTADDTTTAADGAFSVVQATTADTDATEPAEAAKPAAAAGQSPVAPAEVEVEIESGEASISEVLACFLISPKDIVKEKWMRWSKWKALLKLFERSMRLDLADLQLDRLEAGLVKAPIDPEKAGSAEDSEARAKQEKADAKKEAERRKRELKKQQKAAKEAAAKEAALAAEKAAKEAAEGGPKKDASTEKKGGKGGKGKAVGEELLAAQTVPATLSKAEKSEAEKEKLLINRTIELFKAGCGSEILMESNTVSEHGNRNILCLNLQSGLSPLLSGPEDKEGGVHTITADYESLIRRPVMQHLLACNGKIGVVSVPAAGQPKQGSAAYTAAQNAAKRRGLEMIPGGSSFGTETHCFDATVPRGKWCHIAFVATTNPKNSLTCYMDGKLLKQIKGIAFPLPMRAIGGSAGRIASFEGCMLDARLWRTQRSAIQIQDTLHSLIVLRDRKVGESVSVPSSRQQREGASLTSGGGSRPGTKGAAVTALSTARSEGLNTSRTAVSEKYTEDGIAIPTVEAEENENSTAGDTSPKKRPKTPKMPVVPRTKAEILSDDGLIGWWPFEDGPPPPSAVPPFRVTDVTGLRFKTPLMPGGLFNLLTHTAGYEPPVNKKKKTGNANEGGDVIPFCYGIPAKIAELAAVRAATAASRVGTAMSTTATATATSSSSSSMPSPGKPFPGKPPSAGQAVVVAATGTTTTTAAAGSGAVVGACDGTNDSAQDWSFMGGAGLTTTGAGCIGSRPGTAAGGHQGGGGKLLAVNRPFADVVPLSIASALRRAQYQALTTGWKWVDAEALPLPVTAAQRRALKAKAAAEAAAAAEATAAATAADEVDGIGVLVSGTKGEDASESIDDVVTNSDGIVVSTNNPAAAAMAAQGRSVSSKGSKRRPKGSPPRQQQRGGGNGSGGSGGDTKGRKGAKNGGIAVAIGRTDKARGGGGAAASTSGVSPGKTKAASVASDVSSSAPGSTDPYRSPLPIPSFKQRALCPFEIHKQRLATLGRKHRLHADCPLGCSVNTLTQGDIRFHVKFECVKRRVKCRFALLGCSAVFPAEFRTQHERNGSCYVVQHRNKILDQAGDRNLSVNCELCSEHVRLRDLGHHQSQVCAHRKVHCPHADCAFSSRHAAETEEISGGAYLMAHQLDHHLKFDCQSKEVTQRYFLVDRARTRAPYPRPWGIDVMMMSPSTIAATNIDTIAEGAAEVNGAGDAHAVSAAAGEDNIQAGDDVSPLGDDAAAAGAGAAVVSGDEDVSGSEQQGPAIEFTDDISEFSPRSLN